MIGKMIGRMAVSIRMVERTPCEEGHASPFNWRRKYINVTSSLKYTISVLQTGCFRP